METLIFIPMNLRLRSFLFRLPLFFFRTNRKRAEKKHIFCPACFYFFLPSTSYVYITSQEPALYGMHFCIASKQKFPTLIPIPFSAGIDRSDIFWIHPVHSVWVFDPFNLEKNEIAAPNRPCRIFFFHTDRNKPVIK